MTPWQEGKVGAKIEIRLKITEFGLWAGKMELTGRIVVDSCPRGPIRKDQRCLQTDPVKG